MVLETWLQKTLKTAVFSSASSIIEKPEFLAQTGKMTEGRLR